MIANFMGISGVMIFSGWLSTRMNYLTRMYSDYMERVSIINSCNNLSIYKNKESQYMTPIKKFRVFKKSNFRVNSYYWKIKTKDSSYYYTTTDDELSTLHNILKTTKISEFRGKCVNDFFEYCLVSYVADENEKLMGQLSKGCLVELNKCGALICTQERFEQMKQNYESTLQTKQDCKYSSHKTPDLYIECNGQSCIIDAYNGTNEKEILKKLNTYSFEFPNCQVYVFSSGVSVLEQLTTKCVPTFSFHCIKDEKLTTVNKIECGTFILEISALCDKYFSEYRVFKSEIFYWLNCEQEGKIIQTNIDSK